MADLPVRPLVSRLYMADAFGESRLRRYMFTPESTFFASESAIYRRNVSRQSSKSAIHKADTLKNGLIVVWPESGAQSETKRASRFIPPFSVDVMARWRYLAVTRRNVFKTRAAFHTVLSAPYDGAGNVNSKRKKEEGDMGQLDSGNAAWILTSASLVFLMTPGVAFFYGGMVRAKAVLNMMIMEAAALSVTMVIWVLWGWSIAYAGTSVGGVFGDPATGFLLKDSMVSDGGVFTSASLNSNNYPVSVDVAFQSAFAMITVALICGAIAERVKYSTWMIFVALWITFDYAPLAHMVWNGGLLSADGAISQAIGAAAHDFAGGTVVHSGDRVDHRQAQGLRHPAVPSAQCSVRDAWRFPAVVRMVRLQRWFRVCRQWHRRLRLGFHFRCNRRRNALLGLH